MFHEGILTQETRDHTLAQERIDAGEKPEEVKRVRNVLTRCLSSISPNSTADIHYLRLTPGDILLLCTDGLSDLVNDEKIAATLASQSDLQHMSNDLLQAALQRGGKDNVTLVLARFFTPGLHA